MLSMLVTATISSDAIFGEETHLRVDGQARQFLNISTSTLDFDKGLRMIKASFNQNHLILVRVSYQSGFIDLVVRRGLDVRIQSQFGNVESNPEVKQIREQFKSA